jgi:hypothetical protein
MEFDGRPFEGIEFDGIERAPPVPEFEPNAVPSPWEVPLPKPLAPLSAPLPPNMVLLCAKAALGIAAQARHTTNAISPCGKDRNCMHSLPCGNRTLYILTMSGFDGKQSRGASCDDTMQFNTCGDAFDSEEIGTLTDSSRTGLR